MGYFQFVHNNLMFMKGCEYMEAGYDTGLGEVLISADVIEKCAGASACECFGVVGMASLCVFVFKLGMLGVFIAVLCDEAIRMVINFIRFLKIKF